MPSLSPEKIAEIQTIAELLGKPVAAEEIVSRYEDNLLALTDPAAFAEQLKARTIVTGPGR